MEVIDPKQLLIMSEKERVRAFETLISDSPISVRVDDSWAELSVNRTHERISELASRLIQLESKREVLCPNYQTLIEGKEDSDEEKQGSSDAEKQGSSDEEKQGSSKRRRTTTTIADIGKEIVDVLKILHNLSSNRELASTNPGVLFGMRHWGIMFLCEILIRLEWRRSIKEQEEQELLMNGTLTDCNGDEDLHGMQLINGTLTDCNADEDLQGMLLMIDRNIAAHTKAFYKITGESREETQVMTVNYSSEVFWLQKSRQLWLKNKTSKNQVERRLQQVKKMNSQYINITEADVAFMLDGMEKKIACTLEAFQRPNLCSSRIVALSRELLMLERSKDALLLGDSPEEADNVFSTFVSDDDACEEYVKDYMESVTGRSNVDEDIFAKFIY